jgi:hypothetical protein
MAFILKSVGVIFAGLVLIVACSDSSTTASTTEYSKCKNDPTNKVRASMYKQQHPNLSTNQILHVLCK